MTLVHGQGDELPPGHARQGQPRGAKPTPTRPRGRHAQNSLLAGLRRNDFASPAFAIGFACQDTSKIPFLPRLRGLGIWQCGDHIPVAKTGTSLLNSKVVSPLLQPALKLPRDRWAHRQALRRWAGACPEDLYGSAKFLDHRSRTNQKRTRPALVPFETG
jgi:hypothetical protein